MEKIGNSSCTLYMEARSFNVYTHAEEVLLETGITFVRIDEDGNPTCNCHGQSISLGLASDEEEDTRLAQYQLGLRYY